MDDDDSVRSATKFTSTGGDPGHVNGSIPAVWLSAASNRGWDPGPIKWSIPAAWLSGRRVRRWVVTVVLQIISSFSHEFGLVSFFPDANI